MMTSNVLFFLATFVFMEFVAWFTHKYVMHGLLWRLHSDHHNKDHDGLFERNDAFFLIFAVPGILLIYLGTKSGQMDPRFWIGAGITCYGVAYIFVHDIFIHQRFRLYTRTSNIYFSALRKAHKVHHKHLGKEDGECFGMLWPTRKYLAEARQKKKKYGT